MCDYSLQGIPNRLAREGEFLVVHRFETGSKGLTAPEHRRPAGPAEGFASALKSTFRTPPRACAVCIPDGARLMVHGLPPAQQQTYGVRGTEAAVFRQLSANAQTYRDALEFENGVKVRLQDLQEGLRMEVLALSCRSDPGEVELPSLAEAGRSL